MSIKIFILPKQISGHAPARANTGKYATGFERAVEDAQAPRAAALTFDDLDTELVVGVRSKIEQFDGELGAVDKALFAGEFRVVAYDVEARVVNSLRAAQSRVGPRQTGASCR